MHQAKTSWSMRWRTKMMKSKNHLISTIVMKKKTRRILRKTFSLEYMTRTVNFYDEVNPKTSQRKRRWPTVKHNFWCIPHQTYIDRFRRYLERYSKKKQKIDKVDDYVFDMVERARGNSLSVHDIDIRRWVLKRAMGESLHNFVASRHWLHTCTHKHNIISYKVTNSQKYLGHFIC